MVLVHVTMSDLLWVCLYFLLVHSLLTQCLKKTQLVLLFLLILLNHFLHMEKISSLCGFNVSIEQRMLGVLAHGKEKKARVKAFGSSA